MIVIRAMAAGDRAQVLALAHRLTVGVAPWRDADRVLHAVREWVESDMDRAADDSRSLQVYVAADGPEVAGFVTVTESAHWSGENDAYIGELVVDNWHERQGIATELVHAAERWAATRGLARIRLSTGAANTPALRLYDALGYAAEDVTLSKRLR